MSKTRTLDSTNSAQAKASGTSVFGNPDMWVCIAKAWNKQEEWMKSTKVLEVRGVGVFLQTTTREGNQISESVYFAPGICLNLMKTELVPLRGNNEMEIECK